MVQINSPNPLLAKPRQRYSFLLILKAIWVCSRGDEHAILLYTTLGDFIFKVG